MAARFWFSCTCSVIAIPTNDLAYTNCVYVHPDFAPGLKRVQIYNGIFNLQRRIEIPPGHIAMSSLQRECLNPPIPLPSLVQVYEPRDLIIPAKELVFSVELVANFRKTIDKSKLEDFLKVQYEGHVVHLGSILASFAFGDRVLKYRVISGFGEIGPETKISCVIADKSKDILSFAQEEQENKQISDYSVDALNNVSLAVGILEDIMEATDEPYTTIRVLLWKHLGKLLSK